MDVDFKMVTATIGILLVFIYAFGSGIWVSSSPGWYSTLNRPPWQPPSSFIGIIWPYNFIVLGFASYQVSKSLTRIENITWLVFFGLSIAAALTWAYQFYVPHNFTFATIALALAALLTIPVLYLTFRASLIMGLLLIPYQIWVTIAATLAWGYLTRNQVS
jgi:tryptophan-rich sensory protein